MSAKIIGCGYCAHEKQCPKRNPKINKAKAGCKDYVRFDQHFKLKKDE